ncbi:MAG: hypothetical protein ACXABY_09165 [Candidatus Thorarchaeota archaeon]
MNEPSVHPRAKYKTRPKRYDDLDLKCEYCPDKNPTLMVVEKDHGRIVMAICNTCWIECGCF